MRNGGGGAEMVSGGRGVGRGASKRLLSLPFAAMCGDGGFFGGEGLWRRPQNDPTPPPPPPLIVPIRDGSRCYRLVPVERPGGAMGGRCLDSLCDAAGWDFNAARRIAAAFPAPSLWQNHSHPFLQAREGEIRTPEVGRGGGGSHFGGGPNPN